MSRVHVLTAFGITRTPMGGDRRQRHRMLPIQVRLVRSSADPAPPVTSRSVPGTGGE